MIRMFLIIVLILCGVAWAGIWLARVPIVETVLSKKLKTEVTVQDVSIRWGKVTLENLQIKNLSPSKLPLAFETGSLIVQFNPFELFKEQTHIQRIKIQDPHLTIELYNTTGNENNWISLLSKLPAPSSTQSTSKTSSHHPLIIDRLSLVNVHIDIIRPGGKVITIPAIPYLEFQGIGEQGSINFSTLFRELFIKILESTQSKQALGSILDQLSSQENGQPPSSSMDSIKSTMKEGIDALKRKAGEAQEYLQNLFSN